MPRQLAFDLPVRPALGRDDYVVSASNTLALAALDGWAGWPGGKLALIGPHGAGKTHLAHVWAGDSGATITQADGLAQVDVPGLAATRRVVVEDLEALTALPAPQAADAEQALFHLHNLVLAEGGRLLLTGTTPPMRWHLRLPDLASRMQACTLARLDPPDDALLGAILVKLSADRGLSIRPALIQYLLKRMERSHHAAVRLVAIMDQMALEKGGGLTQQIAATALDIRAADDE